MLWPKNPYTDTLTLLQAGRGVLLGTVRWVVLSVLSDLSVIGISNTPFIFGVLTRPGDFDRPETADRVELTGALVTRRLDSKIEWTWSFILNKQTNKQNCRLYMWNFFIGMHVGDGVKWIRGRLYGSLGFKIYKSPRSNVRKIRVWNVSSNCELIVNYLRRLNKNFSKFSTDSRAQDQRFDDYCISSFRLN